MPDLADITLDFDTHERTRLALVLEAIGDRYDPAAVFTSEMQADAMLYGNLDPQQLAVYDELVEAGVLR